jgi:hypothetical protein
MTCLQFNEHFAGCGPALLAITPESALLRGQP